MCGLRKIKLNKIFLVFLLIVLSLLLSVPFAVISSPSAFVNHVERKQQEPLSVINVALFAVTLRKQGSISQAATSLAKRKGMTLKRILAPWAYEK